MRPTICDQAQVERTLCSGVRAQNEGKFELFVVTSTLTPSTIPHNAHNLLIDGRGRDQQTPKWSLPLL